MFRHFRTFGILLAALAGCSQVQSGGTAQQGPPNQFVLLGESNVTGEEAAQEANVIVQNANAAGCRGLSVGGYATSALDVSPVQLVYGVPVLIDCPPGVILLPNGAAQ